ncbi:MAG: FecR domain-containing protein [Chitinophagaceae bacterium]|nr:FecR domain-containing protein [Chitinophagaceae bacterium]
MESSEQQCRELFDRWYRQQLTDAELPKLWELLAEADQKGILEPMMREAYETLQADPFFTTDRIRQLSDAITGRKHAKIRSFPWRKWISAASIILAIGIAGNFFFSDKGNHNTGISETTPAIPHDVGAPQVNRATITMSNGKTVYLDSVTNGTVSTIGTVRLVKLDDGKIAYNGSTAELIYNTLTNPRGSKVIDMMLADGSRVWLNAGSSITYPIAFIGNERKVSVTGEAYFEVTRDAARSFTINTGKTIVQVLGTHFNVNAYDDEADIKVTLLEGSVKVVNGQSSSIMTPGQQAQVSDRIKIINDVALEQVMAWKNGYFPLKSTDFSTLMRQIARWYDVSIVYEGEKPEKKFGGSISRDVNLSTVLQALKENGIRSKIEGNKIIIME